MTGAGVDKLIAQYGAERVIDAVTPLLVDSRVSTLDQGLSNRLQSLTLVMENLYDPHNGAAALRSAEAFGLTDMHTIDGSTGAFQAAKDVCVGSQKWIDLHSHGSVAECASTLRKQGFVLCATVPGAEMELDDIPVDKPLAIWFGNERDGLTEEAQEACDHLVSIRMSGFCQSFNLSVSVGIFLHRLSGKRRTHLETEGDLDDARMRHLQARWRAMGMRGLEQILQRLYGDGN